MPCLIKHHTMNTSSSAWPSLYTDWPTPELRILKLGLCVVTLQKSTTSSHRNNN